VLEPTRPDSPPPDPYQKAVPTGSSAPLSSDTSGDSLPEPALGNHEAQALADPGNDDLSDTKAPNGDQPTARPSPSVEHREYGRLPGPGWGSQFKVPLIAYGPPIDIQLHRRLQEVKKKARDRALGITPKKDMRHAGAGTFISRKRPQPPEPSSPLNYDNEPQGLQENKGEAFPLVTPFSQESQDSNEDLPQHTITRKVTSEIKEEVIQNGKGEIKVGSFAQVVETVETVTNNLEVEENQIQEGETQQQTFEEIESQAKEKLTKKRKKRKIDNVLPSRHSKRLSVRSSSRS